MYSPWHRARACLPKIDVFGGSEADHGAGPSACDRSFSRTAAMRLCTANGGSLFHRKDEDRADYIGDSCTDPATHPHRCNPYFGRHLAVGEPRTTACAHSSTPLLATAHLPTVCRSLLPSTLNTCRIEANPWRLTWAVLGRYSTVYAAWPRGWTTAATQDVFTIEMNHTASESLIEQAR
jgi:hypothetical protein